MPITVKLNGGVEIHVDDADFMALQEAFEIALAANKPLEIHSPNGRTAVVNPHNILYLEGPSQVRPSSNGVTRSDRAASAAL